MKNIKEFIPLGISIILILISIVNVLTTNTVFNRTHYLGIIILSVSTVLFFKNQRIFIFFFGISLLLGLIGIINFFYLTINVGFGEFQINPIFLILTVLFIALNEKILNKLFPKGELGGEISETNQSGLDDKIKMFKKQFENKTESELIKISEENSSYTELAKIAAEQLIREKNVL